MIGHYYCLINTNGTLLKKGLDIWIITSFN